MVDAVGVRELLEEGVDVLLDVSELVPHALTEGDTLTVDVLLDVGESES